MRPPRRHLIRDADLWPRDDEHRYRLYARRGDQLDVLAAAPTPQGIGLAIVTLHEEEKLRGRRLVDRGMIGILDVLPDRFPGPTGEWIILRGRVAATARKPIRRQRWHTST